MVWELNDTDDDGIRSLWVANESHYHHHSDKNVAIRPDSELYAVNEAIEFTRIIKPLYDKARYNPTVYNDPKELLFLMDGLLDINPESWCYLLHGNWRYCACGQWRLLSFMSDVVDFLETGQRNTPIDAYAISIQDGCWGRATDNPDRNEVRQFDDLKRQLMERFSNLPKLETKHDILKYIIMWCSHHGGVKDMVQTLYVLSTAKP